MVRISHFGFALALPMLGGYSTCLAAWSISAHPAVFVDDCNEASPGPMLNWTPATYVTPPAAYPTPNSYYRAESGSAQLTIMDAYCGSEDCYDFGKSLLVEFDWLALESTHLAVQTTFHPPVFPYEVEVSRFSSLFADLPMSPPEYASTPESRRVSFLTYYETLDGSDLLTLEFRATNTLGEASAFGVDNLIVASVPEPVTTASLITGIVTIATFGSRDVDSRKRRWLLGIG